MLGIVNFNIPSCGQMQGLTATQVVIQTAFMGPPMPRQDHATERRCLLGPVWEILCLLR